MKITTIHIHNFRSFLDETIVLNDFSLLIGSNNAGKSNVIRALRVFYEDSVKFNFKTDFPKTTVLDKESWIEIHYQTTPDEQESLKDEYKSKDKILKVRKYLVSEEFVKPSQSNIYGYEGGSLSKNLFYGAKNVSNAKLGQVVFVPPVSRADDSFKMSGPSPFRNVINFVCQDILKKSPSYDSLKTQFDTFRGTIKSEKNSDDVSLDDVVSLINKEISSWDGISFGLDLEEMSPDLVVKNLISPFVKDSALDGSKQNIEEFGQGFQRSLISTLIQVDATINKKKSVGVKKEFSPDFTLMLFEEPEAFLHFSQEQRLNQNLRRLAKEEDKQLLITTHSPFFVGRACNDLTNLIKLKRTSGKTEVFQLTKDDIDELCSSNIEVSKVWGDTPLPEESEILRYFISLDGERSSMFFSNDVLICEGATERIFFNYLFDSSWQDLSEKGIFVVDSLGKPNIHRVMNLCAKLGIDHSVLFDGDSDKGRHKATNAWIISKKNGYTKGIDNFDEDLETFLGVSTPSEPWMKPLSLLMKLEAKDIKEQNLTDLKTKLTKILNT
jgi:putative ATP-dependent endonuclease of OLD family